MGKSSLALEIAANLARRTEMTLSDAAVGAAPQVETAPGDRGFLPVHPEQAAIDPAVEATVS